MEPLAAAKGGDPMPATGGESPGESLGFRLVIAFAVQFIPRKLGTNWINDFLRCVSGLENQQISGTSNRQRKRLGVPAKKGASNGSLFSGDASVS